MNSYQPMQTCLTSKQFGERAIIEDLTNHDFDLSSGFDDDQELDLTPHERLLVFWFPWVFTLIGAAILISLAAWLSNAESPRPADMPQAFLISVRMLSTVVLLVSVILIMCIARIEVRTSQSISSSFMT
jgi:hypothetical protein